MEISQYIQNEDLKNICPIWHNRLTSNTKFPTYLSLSWFKWFFELDSPKKCIVGEAHNYNSEYEKNCKECDLLGWEFGSYFLRNSREEFDRVLKKFIMHWNMKHKKTI